MNGYTFNKKDFDKLVAIAGNLNVIAKSKGFYSTVLDMDGEFEEITVNQIEEFLESIFDKQPDSDWED